MTARDTALQRARAIREVLLDHGVPEVSIELQTGRTGGWNGLDPVEVKSHHIVSRPTPANPTPGLRLVKVGRPDLRGPLANGHAGVDLVYRILCLDWANHPGYGGPLRVTGPCGSFTIPRDNARPYSWGTEYEGGLDDATWDRVYTNRRTGKKMTFREFMGRSNAGLVEAIWLPGVSSRGKYEIARKAPRGVLAGYHGEHSTWTDRKIDRRGYTTSSGRAELRRWDVDVPPAPPKPTGSLTRGPKVDEMLRLNAAALREAKPGTRRHRELIEARRDLRQVPAWAKGS